MVYKDCPAHPVLCVCVCSLRCNLVWLWLVGLMSCRPPIASSKESVDALSQERHHLVGQLQRLFQHMQSVRQAQDNAERAAMARGGTVLEDVRALEEQILSWYQSEDAAAAAAGGGHGARGTPDYATMPLEPTGSFVVGPSALAKSRAYDLARSVTSPPQPQPQPHAHAPHQPPQPPRQQQHQQHQHVLYPPPPHSQQAHTPAFASTGLSWPQVPRSTAMSMDHAPAAVAPVGAPTPRSVQGLLSDAGLAAPATPSQAPQAPQASGGYTNVPSFSFSAVGGGAGAAAAPSASGVSTSTTPAYSAHSAGGTTNMTIRSLLGGTSHDVSAARALVDSHLGY